MPGAHGPVPNRSDQRRRRNKPDVALSKAASASPTVVEPPMPDDEWHPMARDWFLSLAASGQRQFYEASDWQTARVWAEVLSRQLHQARPSAQMIAAWSAGATELLTTEGARRRARVELERAAVDEDEAASVTALETYRADVGA
jgi:hypothetical protein